jgi:hypothetical protein
MDEILWSNRNISDFHNFHRFNQQMPLLSHNNGLGSGYLVEGIICGGSILCFILHQYNGSWKRDFLQNQFVLITLVANFSNLVFIVLNVANFFGAESETQNLMGLGIFFYAATARLHTCLVYIRSKAVFETSFRYIRVPY